ncbi:MAG TPA: drug/metabolite exporter YedA [Ktedonobacterales bacterium]|nr:drug/metabolite exporter YedA [Ktedonobacterales bacterium]
MSANRASPRTQVILAFLSVYIIWGSTYLAIRFAVATMPPFLMAGVRFLIAGAILYLLVRLRGAERPKLVHWRSALIVGGLLLFCGNGGVSWAEVQVPSGLAALLVAVVPLWMALFDWLRPGGVYPGALAIVGLIIGFAGVALLASQAESSGTGPQLAGILALVVATCCWAIGSLYARNAPFPKTQLLGTGMEMLAGGAVLVFVAGITGEWGQVHFAAISVKSLLALAFLIVFGSLIAFSAYVWLLHHVSAVSVSTYAYVNPVVAVFLGWAFADEAITWVTLVSAAIIISAVALITVARARGAQPQQVTAPAGDDSTAPAEAIAQR